MPGYFSRIARTVMSNGVLRALPRLMWLVCQEFDSRLFLENHTEDSRPKERFRTSMASLEVKRPPFPIRPSVEGPLRVDMLSTGRD